MKESGYGEKLRKRLKELCITQAELAKEIGVSQKTISTYLECEDTQLKNIQTQYKIETALEKLSDFYGYHHMDREQFGDLLDSLLREFIISQNKLAKAIGKHQKDISGYINKTLPTSVREQYEILEIFYQMCNFEYGMSSEHFDTAMKLMNLIHNEKYEEMLDIFESEDSDVDEECNTFSENCEMYILKLPVKLQYFIYENFAAYFEETMFHVGICSDISFTYNQRLKWLKRFRQMNSDQQQKFVSKLEQSAVISYPEGSIEEIYFDCITTMRKIITSNIPFTDHDKLRKNEIPRSKKAQSWFRDELERVTCDFGTYVSSVEELKLKLSFTRYEWYFWMLLLINIYNDTFPEIYDIY